MKKNTKVLVIDDESHICRVIEVKLQKYGYQVHYACNGKEGLEVIQRLKPQIVITDINMPVMDGKAFCLQSNPWKQLWPFLTVVITARINPEDRTWASKLQDTLFMEKPFSTSVLKEHIEQYLEMQTP